MTADWVLTRKVKRVSSHSIDRKYRRLFCQFVDFSTAYEVSPKSNETGFIKTLLKYTKVKFLQSNPLPLENTCAFTFTTIQNILGRHFLGSFSAPSLQPF